MQAEAPVVVRVCRFVDPLLIAVRTAEPPVKREPVLKWEDGQHGRGVEKFPQHVAHFPWLRIGAALHAQGRHVVAGGGADAQLSPLAFVFHAAHLQGQNPFVSHDSRYAGRYHAEVFSAGEHACSTEQLRQFLLCVAAPEVIVAVEEEVVVQGSELLLLPLRQSL